ncbi:hypothetical protein [uncultured Desulfuromusa sp.]|uniref:hypothetical protein n=1 Tax=uncultured Desulfuromusa sp. TaxID=219183 RepID=UPI002AA76D54|nr:hypothetical protein [uncultured Desulfuromusa sp.]
MYWQERSFNSRRQLLTIFFIIVILAAQRLPVQANQRADLTGDELNNSVLLMTSVASFKETARADYAQALLTFSKERGMAQLHKIDQLIWEAPQAQLGWMSFFNSAIVAYAGIEEKSPVVGFYNPYSDVLLITAWAKDQDIYQIVDAEILMGDWIRRDNKDLDLIPLWLRGSQHRPVTLGLSVAKTLLSFEEIFSAATLTNWRQKLLILNDEDLLDDVNTPSIILMMNEHLLTLLDFSAPEEEDEFTKTCKKRASDVIKLAADNKFDTLLSVADETLPQTARHIRTYPEEWFSSLSVANVRTGPEGCLVFLSHPQQTSRNLALFFQGAKSIYLRPKRIDLIDYQFFYNELKQDPTKGGIL